MIAGLTSVGRLKKYLIVLFLLTQSTAATAQSLKVAIKSSPPFSIQTAQGNWQGISVELWDDIAKQLNLEYEWVVIEDIQAQFNQLQQGQIDVAVGALTMTADREHLIDFSHTFYSTGLGIAAQKKQNSIVAILQQLMSWQFLRAVGVLLSVLLAVGLLIWLLEHKKNAAQFGGGVRQGIGSGLWWSAVTMTTVGYGDKAPITFFGRSLATVWMFVSIVTISGFTAAIASAFTMNQLNGLVAGEQDLPYIRVATVKNSTADAYLRDAGIIRRSVDNAVEGLTALANNQFDALVYDAPLLEYQILQNQFDQLQVLPKTFFRQNYAFALRPNFAHREAINRALLTFVQQDEWDYLLKKYLGGS